MSLEDFLGVATVDDVHAFRTQVVGFTRRLGFETVHATFVVDRPPREPDFVWVDHTPEAYRELFNDPEGGRNDPVSQHCKHSSVPIIWDQSTYVAAGRGEKWEIQARYGYRTGMALALHMRAGRHFFIGVDRDQSLPSDPDELARMAGALYLFAAHAQEAAQRLLVRDAHQLQAVRLTSREIEALQWTLEGKTAWEIGRILSISEQTAARHVNNATRKLECVNKLPAAVKALRMGLIT
jgi:DNA-binding CsgD family transcriptional regulator